ncbi:MAG: L-rhamnose isomerase [Alphaproteobacteria bacterium]|jgi:L-rhamnose isomerase|nr:L-rhamnose isomerase [Alphaproteobacteria bacterium]
MDSVKEKYAAIGVDVDSAIEKLKKIKISLHCWQGDDVNGFMNKSANKGGVMATGNYPYMATTPQELREDLEKALSYIPGKHKVNLHAIYVDTDEQIDAVDIAPKHFAKWVDWAKKHGLGLDFNPTCFANQMFKDGFTIAHSDKAVANYWIEHCKKSRKIANYFGAELGQQAVNNFWFPDGYKDTPVDRLAPRARMAEAMNEVLSEKMDSKNHLDTIESKLFGIGVESYVVASHEFCTLYAQQKNIGVCLDSGHFHLTESVADKMSNFKLFNVPLLLHVSRPVRWDSDHVVAYDDALVAMTGELIKNNMLDSTHIGLDFFDASINRIAAWAIGSRNTLKSLLFALLQPTQKLKEIELGGDLTSRLAITEELKSYPFGEVWDYYCQQMGVLQGLDWLKDLKQHESTILVKRK